MRIQLWLLLMLLPLLLQKEGRRSPQLLLHGFRRTRNNLPLSLNTHTNTHTHLLDNLVVRQRDAVAADLAIAALVDQLTHGLEVGVAPCNVGLHTLEQTERGLVNLCSQVVEGGMCDVKQR